MTDAPLLSLAGLVASAAHILVQPNSTIPVVGASGAIAGVMGAYLVLFPNVKIRSLIIFFIIFFYFIRSTLALIKLFFDECCSIARL